MVIFCIAKARARFITLSGTLRKDVEQIAKVRFVGGVT